MSFVPRLFLPSIAEGQSEVALDDSASHYLTKVLRLAEGDPFLGFDSRGFQYDLNLKKSGPGPATASVLRRREKARNDSGVFLALGQGLPKAAKMDLILRQGTEVGLHRFIPLVTQRSISRPDSSQYGHKNDRWQKILVEACRQCGRDDVPRLDPLTQWEKGLELFREFDLVLMPYEKDAPVLKTVLESAPIAGKILVLIGPEGGWDPGEIREAQQKGAAPVHLPTPILRTETAGVVVASMLQYYFNSTPGGAP